MEFTRESWTQFLSLMSAVYAWHLTEVDLNHCHHWNVTTCTCEQSTRSKLSCVFNLSCLHSGSLTMHSGNIPSPTEFMSSVYGRKQAYIIYIYTYMYTHEHSPVSLVWGSPNAQAHPNYIPAFRYTKIFTMYTPTLLETQRLQIIPPILTLIRPHTNPLLGFHTEFSSGGRGGGT